MNKNNTGLVRKHVSDIESPASPARKKTRETAPSSIPTSAERRHSQVLEAITSLSSKMDSVVEEQRVFRKSVEEQLAHISERCSELKEEFSGEIGALKAHVDEVGSKLFDVERDVHEKIVQVKSRLEAIEEKGVLGFIRKKP